MYFWQRAGYLRKRAEWLASQTFVVLAIQVPKENEKTPQSAEQFFAALHGIYRKDPVIQEHVSFEIVAKKDAITFYVFTPLHLREFIEGQLYAQYPNLNITHVTDYAKDVQLTGLHVASTKIVLTKEDVYPIKTFATTEVDPLAGITAVLSGLEEQEQVWLQYTVRPVGDEWQNKGVKYVRDIRAGKKMGSRSGGVIVIIFRLLGHVLQEFIQPGADAAAMGKSAEAPKLSAPQEAALKGVETKITKLGFEALFRLAVISSDSLIAKSRTQALLAALKQYNTTNLNGFAGGDTKVDDYVSWQQLVTREFEEKGNVLNIEELASIYHFPSQSVETSAISWAGSKKGESPFNLPLKDTTDASDLTVIGKTDFRNSQKEFGIKLDDRKRHIYVIGKSGTGKSTLLENMIIDDINEGRGVIVVDPHGELADKIVESIPEHRIQDAVVLDPSDREFPVAFNLLEQVGEDFKGIVASGFVGIFKKIFGNSWGPRLEYILRNTVLALLETPDATMMGIPRMLTERGYRERVTAQIKDTVIRDFWTNEWNAMTPTMQAEALGPILNKVGQFLSTSTIRNIVGQSKSTFNIRTIMDEQKILIVNLAKGKIGEDNMALLGAMIITKVQLAAMGRSNVKAWERPDCFLYVDEFQNFATESFASILSEARKYNLGLTIAHQYIAQMSEEVKDAVIGNVGTIVTFRVGGPDAEVLVKEFAPVFEVNDLLNLQKAHIYIKLLVDGIAEPAFSAQTLPPKHIESSYRDQVIEFSRGQYSRPREEVEALIDDTAGYKQKREAEDAMKKAQESLNAASGLAIHPPKPSAVQMMAQPQSPALMAVPRAEASLPVAVHVQDPLPAVSIQNSGTPVVIDENIQQSEQQGRVERPEKPLKTMNGLVWKEVSQKGGDKWFVGEDAEVVKQRQAEKLRLKELERSENNLNGESPMPVSPTEQMANGVIEPEKQKEAVIVPQNEDNTGADVTTLKQGESVNLEL